MHCILFRHGIAESPNTWSGDEYSRPLTKEGVTKTEQAVEGLKRIGVEPTHLLCSPLTRTQQTAEIAKIFYKFLQILRPLQNLSMTNPPCSYSPSYSPSLQRPLPCVSAMSHTWDRLPHSYFLAIILQAFRSKRLAVLSLPFTKTQ